jgi:hypothetical protein
MRLIEEMAGTLPDVRTGPDARGASVDLAAIRRHPEIKWLRADAGDDAADRQARYAATIQIALDLMRSQCSRPA